MVCWYSPAGGDGCFAVDKKTGQVVTTGIVLQRGREYLLSVVALDGLGSRSAPAMLSVVAGARAPQFANASYVVSIPENTPEGQPYVSHRPASQLTQVNAGVAVAGEN